MLREHPATARRLAWRLGETFFGEGALDAGALKLLAEGLTKRELDTGWAVETILRSKVFFAEANLRRKVLDPVGFVVGAARALELFDPPSSTLVLAEWAGRLGQDLFYPPNVGGWPGGRSWLTTRSLLGRARYALALVAGKDVGRTSPLDALALARKHGHAKDRQSAVAFYTRLLIGTEPSPEWNRRLEAALGAGAGPDPDVLRKAVAVILSSPEAQLA
jgi:uncharacterized protein (DUF1800 family)